MYPTSCSKLSCYLLDLRYHLLTCSLSLDVSLQYSGILLVLVFSTYKIGQSNPSHLIDQPMPSPSTPVLPILTTRTRHYGSKGFRQPTITARHRYTPYISRRDAPPPSPLSPVFPCSFEALIRQFFSNSGGDQEEPSQVGSTNPSGVTQVADSYYLRYQPLRKPSRIR